MIRVTQYTWNVLKRIESHMRSQFRDNPYADVRESVWEKPTMNTVVLHIAVMAEEYLRTTTNPLRDE